VTRLAVVVSTYNRPDALAVVLDGYRRQTDTDFELLVADDGSGSETADLVERSSARMPFPVRHFWHEDRGFRKSRIHNRIIAETAADYLIFTDGDCIPVVTFVSRHRALCERGYFVGGSRVLLSEGLTRRVVAREVDPVEWRWRDWIRARLRGEVNRLSPLVPLSCTARWRQVTPKDWSWVRGANMAFWRSDLLDVNGFEESYPGWGREDTDLAVRAIRTGVRFKSGRYAVPVLHLWHGEEDRSRLVENERLLQDLLGSGRTRAMAGLAERFPG
jgi:glycosyltransferase involved in cell wall biosynthesis